MENFQPGLICLILASLIFCCWRWVAEPAFCKARRRKSARKSVIAYVKDVEAAGDGKTCAMCRGEATKVVPGGVPGIFVCANTALCQSTRSNEVIFSASAEPE